MSSTRLHTTMNSEEKDKYEALWNSLQAALPKNQKKKQTEAHETLENNVQHWQPGLPKAYHENVSRSNIVT